MINFIDPNDVFGCKKDSSGVSVYMEPINAYVLHDSQNDVCQHH